jgi:hypothetical protein
VSPITLPQQFVNIPCAKQLFAGHSPVSRNDTGAALFNCANLLPAKGMNLDYGRSMVCIRSKSDMENSVFMRVRCV